MRAPAAAPRLEELTREQARAFAPEGLVVLPVAAIEQHGPHLPLGTDLYETSHVAERAVAAAAASIPVVLAPALPYGSSHHHLPWSGTMSLRGEVLAAVLADLLASLATGGFRRVFLLNGHGGNHELVELAARDAALAHDLDVAAGSWWAMAREAMLASGAGALGRVPGHAGGFESSLVLALRPELVAAELPARPGAAAPPAAGHRTERHGAWVASDGFSDDPSQASAAAGAALLEVAARVVADALVGFQREPRAGRG